MVFGILAIATAISTGIGWFHSIDVRGWWPMGVSIHLLIDFVYALAFVTLMRVAHSLSLRFAAGYNAVLGVLLVVHSVLFHSTSRGDGGWQKLIHADGTFLGVYGIFLLGAAVLAFTSRDRTRNG